MQMAAAAAKRRPLRAGYDYYRRGPGQATTQTTCSSAPQISIFASCSTCGPCDPKSILRCRCRPGSALSETTRSSVAPPSRKKAPPTPCVGLSAGLKFDVAGEETPMRDKCRARPVVPNSGNRGFCETQERSSCRRVVAGRFLAVILALRQNVGRNAFS